MTSATKIRKTTIKAKRGASAEKPSAEKRKPTAKKKTSRVKKTGGVAPFVRPPGLWSQWRSTKRWGRRGFVPLSPGREKRRHRILPRTVIGISAMFMAFGVGAAFAGASFYAYYDNRLAENERQIVRFVDGFDQQFTDASGALDDLRVDAVDQIREELSPLGEYASEASGVIQLPETVGASVWAVETRTENGRPMVGAAFAVTGHEGGTALITSLSVVRAATAVPSPRIDLVKGDEAYLARLWAWDETHDLALLVTDAELPVLELASPTEQTNSVGRRVFAMSGLGGQGATASPGVLLDQSASGLQHTAVIGAFFEGGPLLNGDGQIVGVSMVDYQPLGIDSGAVEQAPDISAICARVLRCADTANALFIEVGEEGAESE